MADEKLTAKKVLLIVAAILVFFPPALAIYYLIVFATYPLLGVYSVPFAMTAILVPTALVAYALKGR